MSALRNWNHRCCGWTDPTTNKKAGIPFGGELRAALAQLSAWPALGSTWTAPGAYAADGVQLQLGVGASARVQPAQRGGDLDAISFETSEFNIVSAAALQRASRLPVTLINKGDDPSPDLQVGELSVCRVQRPASG